MTVNSAHDLAGRREVVTEVPGPRSRQLQERRHRAVARGVGSALPVYVRAAGAGLLHDIDGNTFVDLCSGLGVTGVGNAAPDVVAAVRGQVSEFTHTCFLATPYEGYVAVCEELADLTPGDHEKRSALFSTGAEAVENAVKVARAATGRAAVVVLDHAYHGRTNLTLGLTARNNPFKQGFGPFTPEIHRIPASYPFRDPAGQTGEQAARRSLEALERQVGGENVAAVVLEPILGEGGFIVPAPGFLPEIARWCAEYGALLVADEIQSGFCRTGAWFASEHEGVVPDLVASAKGIAGGLPLSAVTGRAEIMDAVQAGGFGGTYGGNPVACAAALASIGVMRRDDLAGAARRIEQTLLGRLKDLQSRHEVIGEVRGRGAMIGVELVRPGTDEPAPELAQRIVAACHARGVFLLTVGTYGNVLRFLPPLVIPQGLLDDALDVLEECFAQVAAGGAG
ncbi:aspartate aminotransferase family protein [Kitasatospora herbaricolor]|uniref:4-aminobutyrate--2-oxoglutarate transaminase n=1 Tax=Kitasatospora herbaricolor TaxID=68217 RepID=UPI00174BCB26|nr:4-aminobutyrate--2-oxoglutarate transaminase [Kitasatospora herbaricolor]MDQ0309522.1 4-aminobutyrate aminotransferase/(S)-3-amino-2-methylpropionate transaminase [Kitasatospora herbaricolor]GGV01296.1 aspartate aminotransferase family protein [Kitasatospora herbaricolor]